MPRETQKAGKTPKRSKASNSSPPSKPLKLERLSPNHWDKFPPPVDQRLWKCFMNEEDSDSGASDSQQEELMADPSNGVKTTNTEKSEQKPKLKNEMIKEVLDDSFNDTIYNILNGVEDATITSSSSTSNNSNNSNNSKTSHLLTCTNCSLPILQHPRMGINSHPPPDPEASYCANEPPIVLAGHDVHGNAFPGFKPKQATTTTASVSSKTTPSTSKPKPKPKTDDNKDASGSSPIKSQDSSDNPPNTAPPPAPASAAEYPQIRTPHARCPNPSCGQYKAVNVMAKHLDICLLGKGRRAGREAREKLKDGGSGRATPSFDAGSGSRAGTPVVGAAGGKREKEGEDAAGNGNGNGKKVKRAK